MIHCNHDHASRHQAAATLHLVLGYLLWVAADGGVMLNNPKNLDCFRPTASLCDKDHPENGLVVDRSPVQVSCGRVS